jgi:acid phosphatase
MGGLVAAGVAILLGFFGAHYFSSSHTRLTHLPAQSAGVNATLPAAPAHVVVVVEENKELSNIAGNAHSAPYLNDLMTRAALFTRSYGVAHPSQPNYLALFAGITDTNGDRCPPRGIDVNAPNLATELRAVGRAFAGYSEGLPAAGSRVCAAGQYARKHVPWADFDNVLPSENLPLSALPSNYDHLPAVAFIIPDLVDDMHSASVARGDAWLKAHVGPIINWAMKHNSLVIITWDESDDAIDNHIPTIFVGPMVRWGRYDTPISHYNVLRTIEDLYKTQHAGRSAGVPPVSDVWRAP